MNSFRSYLLKCISIGVAISCILAMGIIVYANPDYDDNSDIITDVSDYEDTSSEYYIDDNSDYYSDNSDEEPTDSEYTSGTDSEYNSGTESYNEPIDSEYVSDINSDTESYNYEEPYESIYENSQQENNQSSHNLIDGNSEINTSEMTSDDWHFDIPSGNISQSTDFSDIKDSEKSPDEVQKDDSQWILYLGIALIIIGLGAIAFVIIRYVMFKKSSEVKLSHQRLQNAKRIPKNNNSNNKKK